MIVFLLVVIVLILAPWLIWVLLAGAVAYGAIIAAAGAVLVVVLILTIFRESTGNWLAKKRLDTKIEEANRIFREKEAARKAGSSSQPKSEPSKESWPRQ
ncbi:TPA: hypothetical protein QEM72_002704 [Pseudomonas putida]|uniref:hypothetical protein n=1 Tax=Pseudomonas putida TaxID=303 RepID=UPI0023641DF9|nr:hypothetical protein [Pseudomonas putida]MDD2076440.1 hypothetical protein [Pseudomonas putida]HDS1692200.1 hypothetical protein [Pseudomonas putida]